MQMHSVTDATLPSTSIAGFAGRVLRGEVPPPPIARDLGFDLVSLAPGQAVVEYSVDLERHANPMGTLHGGILCDLADLAMGIAYGGTLQENESFTTVELTTNFLRPVREGTLTATAHVVHAGRSLGLIECDVHDDRGRLVARVKSTCMTQRGARAAGR
jgi:uncharacterized protein (TIGR00369 family)